jgi:GntR family transcriptional regulator
MDWSAESPPTARDIAAYYRQEIASGRMPPLRQLPAARALAKRLGVALATVQSAYAQLHDDGLVDARQGSGTFVRDTASGTPSAQETAMGLRDLQNQVQQLTSRLTDLSERVATLEADKVPPETEDL